MYFINGDESKWVDKDGNERKYFHTGITGVMGYDERKALAIQDHTMLPKDWKIEDKSD